MLFTSLVFMLIGHVTVFNPTDTSRLYFPFDFMGFFWVDPKKKIRRVCMEFSEYNWATISETICREMLIFGK